MAEKNGNGGRTQQGIQSVETGFRVLEVLIATETTLSLKSLAERTGIPPSNVHRYLVSFIRTGLVEQCSDSGRYCLGRMALQMGMAALNRLDPIEIASKALRDLVDEVDQTALLAVWSERGPVVVRWIRSSRPVILNVYVGAILPVLTSSAARVFMAFMSPSIRDATLHDALARLEPRTSARFDMGRLRAQIDDARRNQLARVEGGVVPGLRAVSAPVIDAQGDPVASMTLLGTLESDVERFENAVLGLRRAAAKVSERLGYRPY
ncbi:IclR family transcriptional regulator [Marinobacter algicola]|uniref:IclR family transcriptional regulator n=1 Tax=Marinobacter algicola TaxID=236100 RepID=UPI003BAC8354